MRSIYKLGWCGGVVNWAMDNDHLGWYGGFVNWARDNDYLGWCGDLLTGL